MARSFSSLVRLALLFSVFVVCMTSVYRVRAKQAPLPPSPSVQRLEIQQTTDGPAIQGLFGRFALSPTPD